MNQGRIADAGTHSLIHRSLVALSAASLVLVATLGARGLLLHSQYGQALGESKAAKQAIVEAAAMVEKGAGVASSSTEAGLGAVSSFQAALVDLARNHGCSVQEVATSSDVQPYVSRFQKDTPATDLVQLTFKAVIVGTPSNLVAVLDSLTDSPIPFEYDSVSIRRQIVNGSETTVEASIDLRVLAKAGGA